MTRHCIIPARGGSTRIPRKNLRPFHGQPIIAYAIRLGRDFFDHVYVTSEDPEIQRYARAAGAIDVVRPDELALDEVGTQTVIEHTIGQLDIRPQDTVCCLYATTPLLTRTDLELADTLLWARLPAYVATVSYPPLADAGAFYYGPAESWIDQVPLFTHRTTLLNLGERAIDINTAADWARAEAKYKEVNG